MARGMYNLIFEDESDEEDAIVRRPRWMRDRSDYFEMYDEEDFKIHFRLSKQSTMFVLELIENQLQFPEKNMSVSPMNQLLATLRFYATGCNQLTIGDYAGFSKPTAHRIIHRVSSAIASLRPQFIKFPETMEELNLAQRDFYAIAKFPRAIGAMDCTHVKIQSPGGNNAEFYRNRKGYFSVNVQVICNTKLEITDIVARWPGSSHDSTIFNNSNRRACFERGEYGDSVLLVDAGYACRSYLMPPLDNPRSPQEHLFNESQIRSRNPVERTFGCWKRRFPVLSLGLRVSLEHSFAIIVATGVLHNILRQTGEELPPDDPNLNLHLPWQQLLEEGNVQQNNENANRRPRYDSVRHLLIENYFRSLL
ncbi:putative nuclease HARBI1 [Bacillus rossius redtenbacheri]|uniref:putative nuclease HARBI1 n=1 Tax=Bacillus rossius redtenbacheri TaxID=93214 RepID=UPI002FDE97CE